MDKRTASSWIHKSGIRFCSDSAPSKAALLSGCLAYRSWSFFSKCINSKSTKTALSFRNTEPRRLLCYRMLPLFWKAVQFASSCSGKKFQACCIFLGTALALSAVSKKSVTIDEFQALPTGLTILKTGDLRFPKGTPPLSQVLPAIQARRRSVVH